MNFDNNNLPHVEIYKNDIDVTRIIAEKIKQCGHTDSFYVCDFGEILKKYSLWISLLPGIKPFYAVKANNSGNILKLLADFGSNFDCASKNEIDQILSLGIHPDRIIYAHTIKSPESIQYANKVGVKLMTFDNSEELYKMKQLCPDVRAILRIKSDARDALVKFGSKFGCDVEHDAERLIRLAQDLGVDLVGVSFHVGFGCKDFDAFYNAIKLTRTVFNLAKVHGYNLNILDIGGGFPGTNDRYFRKLAVTINQALDEYFSDVSIQVIAEPGTFFVNSSFTLACNIISRKFNSNNKWVYYINDGIFGSFNRDYCFNVPITMYPLKNYRSKNVYSSIIFGVTCATPDRLTNDVTIPNLEIGDWLVFPNMGAYCLSLCTSFNGFSIPHIFYIVNDDTLAVGRFSQDFPFKRASVSLDESLNHFNLRKRFSTIFCIDKD
ncbi:hypothetical protein PPYR_02548 [Photinus pyralis]|uniref:ornithine decarboxylase n=1 Tax=Photinus pyralis TaxID=7054 RepID=A0A5N4B7Q3_PHOPY|nr:ornithine decarboxylase 1-like [Photinus pyralis]KAB0805578.1 hypothetical protein PPYR_02548 [Photinus pyralis]